MTIDLGTSYRSARERLTALVTSPGINPALAVPATPGWTVHDVIAHVSGVAHDAINGNMAGAPGDKWTAAHVARGKDRTIPEMIEEWNEFGPMVEGFLSSPAGASSSAAVFDVHTHEADIRNALGLPLSVPIDFLDLAVPEFRNSFHEAVVSADLPPVEVHAPDVEWFRGRLGRRTEDEVRNYSWSADPDPYLGEWYIFGRAARSLGEHA